MMLVFIDPEIALTGDEWLSALFSAERKFNLDGSNNWLCFLQPETGINIHNDN